MKASKGLSWGLRPLVLAFVVAGLSACGGGGDDAPAGSTGTGSAGSGSISSAVAAYAGQYDLVANGEVVRITVDGNGRVTSCGQTGVQCTGTLTPNGSQGASLRVTANVDGDEVTVEAAITSAGVVSGTWSANTEDGPVGGSVTGTKVPAGGASTGGSGGAGGSGGSSNAGNSGGSGSNTGSTGGKVLSDYAGSYAISGKVDGDSYTVTYTVSASGNIGGCKLGGESFSCSGSLRVLDATSATFDISGTGDDLTFSADGVVDGAGKASGTFRAVAGGETASGSFTGGRQ